MQKFFGVSLCCWVSFAACDDDGKKDNNSDNANNLNNVVQCDPACEEWEICIGTMCHLNKGRCEETADCGDPALECEPESHICQRVTCDTSCPLFAICEDVEGGPTCVTAHFL